MKRSDEIITIKKCSCFHWKKLFCLIIDSSPHVSTDSVSYMLRTWKEYTYLAFIGDTIVGFYIYNTSNPGIAWLELIGVRKDFRNRGIGEILFKSLLENVAKKGIKRIELAVKKDNFPAIKLYEKCGCSILPREGAKSFVTFKHLDLI